MRAARWASNDEWEDIIDSARYEGEDKGANWTKDAEELFTMTEGKGKTIGGEIIKGGKK